MTDTAAIPVENPVLNGADVSRPPVPPVFAAALVEAWAELGTLTKDKQAEVKMREGGSYSYRYADLADLLELARPVLAKHGLALLQPIERTGSGPVVIETWLLHCSGHILSWRFEVAATGTPQAIGSAITYGRRYSAQAALGIAAEDDDGEAASKAPPVQKAAAKKAPAKKAAVPPARSVSEALNRRMHALFTKAHMGGDEMRDTRLATAAAVISRDISSSNDMDDDERRAVIEFLEGEVSPEDDPGPEEGY